MNGAFLLALSNVDCRLSEKPQPPVPRFHSNTAYITVNKALYLIDRFSRYLFAAVVAYDLCDQHCLCLEILPTFRVGHFHIFLSWRQFGFCPVLPGSLVNIAELSFVVDVVVAGDELVLAVGVDFGWFTSGSSEPGSYLWPLRDLWTAVTS